MFAEALLLVSQYASIFAILTSIVLKYFCFIVFILSILIFAVIFLINSSFSELLPDSVSTSLFLVCYSLICMTIFHFGFHVCVTDNLQQSVKWFFFPLLSLYDHFSLHAFLYTEQFLTSQIYVFCQNINMFSVASALSNPSFIFFISAIYFIGSFLAVYTVCMNIHNFFSFLLEVMSC